MSVLKTGDYFGEVSLIENKKRMASIRCLEDCHFAILSKEDFNRALGAIEKRKYNERIQFLQSLPYFDKLTKTSVGKLSYQFVDMSTIKG
jgi:CRP-like cAMP-binding protein